MASSQLSNQNNEVSRLGIRLSFVEVFLEGILIEGANETITTAEVLEKFISPVTEPMKCSYCEYLLQTEPTTSAVGLATVFISHAWQYKFVDVIGALIDYFGSEREGGGEGEGLDVIVWFDIFSNNQHSTQPRSFDWWCNTFKTAIKDIGKTVMVLTPWSNPAPLQRGWCIWELYCTIDTNSVFAVAMNKKSEDEFVNDIDQSSNRAVDKMLTTIDCENSKCTVEVDKSQIYDAIKASVGFTTLNKKIFEAMRSWIIERYGKELNKRKSMNGENDESTLKCMNNLADLYESQSKYELAEPLCLEFLEKTKSALGANHPDTVKSMNNLAVECLEKQKTSLGANHVNGDGLGEPQHVESRTNSNTFSESTYFPQQSSTKNGNALNVTRVKYELSTPKDMERDYVSFEPNHPDRASASKNNFFVRLIKTGKVWKIKILENHHHLISNLQGIDQRGNTLLHYCCHYASMNTVKFISTRNSAVMNFPNNQGNTPSHYAAFWGKQDILEFFSTRISSSIANKNSVFPNAVRSIQTAGLLTDQSFSLEFENDAFAELLQNLKNHLCDELFRALASQFNNSVWELFFRMLNEEIFKHFESYRDDSLPRQLFNGGIYHTVKSFQFTDTADIQYNIVIGQLFYIVMLVVSWFQLTSYYYLGENICDLNDPLDIKVTQFKTNQQYDKWFFYQALRYIDRRTMQALEFKEILTSMINSIKIDWLPESNVESLKLFREKELKVLVFRNVRDRLKAKSDSGTNDPLPREEVPAYAHSFDHLLQLFRSPSVHKIDFLRKLLFLFPELDHYRDLVELPDMEEESNENVNSSLVEIFLEFEDTISMQSSKVKEQNKLLLRLLYLRDIVRRNKKRFPEVQKENFDSLYQLFVPSIQLEDGLHFLLFSLIVDDLGRTKPFHEAVRGYERDHLDQETNPYDYPKCIKRFFLYFRGSEKLEEMIPSYSSLSSYYQDLYLKQLSNSFSLVAFVHGESTPFSVYQLLLTCPHSYERRNILVLQILAFSSLRHTINLESKKLDDALTAQFLAAANLLLNSNDLEDVSLPDISTQIFRLYLSDRMKSIDILEEFEFPEERFALYRVAAWARVTTHQQWQQIYAVWGKLPNEERKQLAHFLNRTGLTSEPAISIYHASSVIENITVAVKSLDRATFPINDSFGQDFTSDGYGMGVYFGLKELLKMFTQVDADLSTGMILAEGKTDEFGGVYVKNASDLAQQMKTIRWNQIH